MDIDFIPFTAPVVFKALTLIILLVFSAFVSGAEAAFFSLTHVDTDKFHKEPGKASETIIKLLEKQNYLLSTILITNNLVNICAVIVANSLIDSIVDFHQSTLLEFIVKTIIVTFLLLLFGEIMPKIAATHNPARFAKFMAIPLDILRRVLKPLSYVLISSSSHINELAARKKANISMDELSEAIEIATPHTAEDKKILTGIVRFVNIEVSDIMRNRVDIVGMDIKSSFEEVKQSIIKSGFSRLPIYEEELDNIKGVLYVKDLLQYVDLSDLEWQKLLRKAYFIPEHKKINDLLEEFQTNQVHLAIVVDEYGSTQGVVSLEDILEEIVGEISDESDLEEKLYTKIDANTYIFEAKTHLSDFERIFNIGDDSVIEDVRGEAETLAGLMLEVKREFLRAGDSLEIGGFIFTVNSLSGRRIDKIKVVRKTV